MISTHRETWVAVTHDFLPTSLTHWAWPLIIQRFRGWDELMPFITAPTSAAVPSCDPPIGFWWGGEQSTAWYIAHALIHIG